MSLIVSAGLPTGMEGLTYPIPFSSPETLIRIAQHAEKQEVAGVVLGRDRNELLFAQSVADDGGPTARYPDLVAIDLGLIGADVDEGVRPAAIRYDEAEAFLRTDHFTVRSARRFPIAR